MSYTLILALATVGISIMAFRDAGLKYRLIFSPTIIESRKEWYRFLTSGAIHGDYMHLGVNMFVFYVFGEQVEMFFKSTMVMGGAKFVVMYLLTIVLANLRTFFKERNNETYFSLGASGGVSGILFSYILIYPTKLLYIYAIIPVPGYVLGPLYLIFSSYMSKRGRDNINHDAHLWGAVVGTVYTLLLDPNLLLKYFTD